MASNFEYTALMALGDWVAKHGVPEIDRMPLQYWKNNMSEYEHKEYSIGFSAKAPETEEEMQLVLKQSLPCFRVELDQATYERFRPMIEEYERKRDEVLAANKFLSAKHYDAD